MSTPIDFYAHDGTTLYCGDALDMLRSEVEDESVDLVVTSPPYPGVPEMWGKLFAPENFDAAHAWLDQVWDECLRVLKPGCVLAVNVANTGRHPYLRNSARVAAWAGRAGMIDEGEIIWNKHNGGSGTSANTAWGTFRNPKYVCLVDQHEYIEIFRKPGERHAPTLAYLIGKDDFMTWRNSDWNIKPASASRAEHIAPFPPELPHRLITLYSFPGEIVLDPFVGSGTTLQEAKKLGRRGIGVEHARKYFDLCKRNLSQYVMPLVSSPSVSAQLLS